MNFDWLVFSLEIVGLIAFSFSGVLAGTKKDLDLIGCLVLGVATGIGGGTLRDVLLDVPVFWLHDEFFYSLNVCIIASVFMYFVSALPKNRERAIDYFDAVGLAIFAVQGFQRAFDVSQNAEIAVVMGVITGCGGGLIRDVCLNRRPYIFRGQMYASAAIFGLLILVFGSSALLSFLLILFLRLLTIKFNIRLK